MYYRMDLVNQDVKELLENIKQEQKEKKELTELYDNLIGLGYTETYVQKRIDFVAQTLTKNNIKFEIKVVNQ